MKKLVITKSVKKMRGKVIHYLCLMGYVTGDNKPDIDRINEFIKNLGANNPRKVILNFLYEKELNPVVSQIEAMYRKEVQRASEETKMRSRVKSAVADALREVRK